MTVSGASKNIAATPIAMLDEEGRRDVACRVAECFLLVARDFCVCGELFFVFLGHKHSKLVFTTDRRLYSLQLCNMRSTSVLWSTIVGATRVVKKVETRFFTKKSWPTKSRASRSHASVFRVADGARARSRAAHCLALARTCANARRCCFRAKKKRMHVRLLIILGCSCKFDEHDDDGGE